MTSQSTETVTRTLHQLLLNSWRNESLRESLGPLLAEDLKLHGPRPDGIAGFSGNVPGRNAYLTHLEQLQLLCGEGRRITLNGRCASEDYVSLSYTLEGVHDKPYLGLPPTGRSLSLDVQDSFRIVDGRIHEIWHSPDRFSLIDTLSHPDAETSSAGLVQTERVTNFRPGSFPESIVRHPNGDFFVTLQMDGQILKISGDQSIVFAQLPKEAMTSFLAGMVTLNVDQQGQLVVVVMSDNPDYQGIWGYRVDTGQGRRLASLPCLSNHLNGSAIDETGSTYVADSTLGIIWRVKPGATSGEIWIRDPLLARRPYVGLAPGANGLRYFRGALYCTVSDRATIIRVPIEENGSAGIATVHCTGVHGDDFAIDDDGTMYVTTHIYNSIVKIAGSGTIIGAIADVSTGIIGSTAAIITRDEAGNKWLYVTNDGGLLNPADGAPIQPNVSRLRL